MFPSVVIEWELYVYLKRSYRLSYRYMPDDHFMVGLWISCLEITSVNQILDCLTLRLKSIINEQDTS